MRGGLLFPVVAIALSGCTAIDLDAIKPKSQSGANCAAPAAMARMAAMNSTTFSPRFLLPNSLIAGKARPMVAGGGVPSVSFAEYARAMTGIKASLPSSLRDDEVVDAIIHIMTKTTGEAHLDAAKAAGLAVTEQDETAIKSYPVPSDISQKQLKSFASKMLDSGLRPVAQSASLKKNTGGDGDAQPALGFYFNAYYEGSYVDRFGTKISKPQFGLTIPDSEITAALTVLLDYLADLADPTPVLGDTATVTAATKYFPGGGGEPTALKAALASYAQLPATGCGVTQENVGQLSSFAQGAADSAGSLSGLVTQSFGGFEIGLGFLGKFSFGDNQLLANLVKTTASRVALRSTFAGLYAAFDDPTAPTKAIFMPAQSGQPALLFR